jgi:hypothetical protein
MTLLLSVMWGSRRVFWKLLFENKLLWSILSNEFSSSDEKLTVFTVYKLFYLYLWTVILLYRPQDLQSWHPLTSIFLDVTSCSLLKVNWHFGGTCHAHLQGQRISQARNQHEAGSKQSFMLVSCLAYSLTLEMGATCSSKTSVDFSRLHGIISQKTELFITTTVWTSNPATV